MLRPTVFALLACLMAIDAAVFEYPLGCDTDVSKLVNTLGDVTTVTATDVVVFGGPSMSHQALKVDGSYVVTSEQLLGGSTDVLKTIAFNFRLIDSSAQGVILDFAGTIKIEQNGEEIIISLRDANDQAKQAVYTKPARIGLWNRIHITTSVAVTTDTLFGSLTNMYDQVFYNAEKGETQNNLQFGAGTLTLSGGIIINSLTVSNAPDGDSESNSQIDSGSPMTLSDEGAILDCPAVDQVVVPTVDPNPIQTVTCDTLTSCPSSVDFPGLDFVDGVTYTCNITPYTIGLQGERVAGTMTTTDAVFVAVDQVTCAVTPGVSAEVTLSSPTHGDAELGTGKVNAFPTCLLCSDNFTESCTAVADACFINDECLTDQDPVTSDPLKICDAESPFVATDPPSQESSELLAPSIADVNDTATSCDDDAISVGALAQPSDLVNVYFFARIPCEGDRTLLTSDNLIITQEENTIKVSIQFEGDEEPRNAEIDLFRHRLRLLNQGSHSVHKWHGRRRNKRHGKRRGKKGRGMRRIKKLIKHHLRHHKKWSVRKWFPGNWRRKCGADINTCRLFIKVRHDVDTGTQLKINGKEPKDPEERFEDTEGLQLSLNGLAFGDDDNVVACLHYNNIDDSCGDRASIRKCKKYVCANKECPETTP